MTALLMLVLAAEGRLTYFGDVRPMFEKSCYGCHAAGVKMGSLDLETWEGVKRGGNNGTVVVPGQPRESRLYTMLMGEAAPAMPMDGKVLPTAQLETVRRWIAEGAEPGTLASPPRLPRIYAMGGAGERLVLGRFQAIDVWERGRVIASGVGHADVVRAVAMTEGGLIAAGGGEPGRPGEVRLWSLRDGRLTLVAVLTGHGEAISVVALAPKGKWLATASSDNRIKIWDVAARREVKTLRDPGGVVGALQFAPDGERLISAGADGKLRVWNAVSGEQLYALNGAAAGLQALALAPDGKRVAAAGMDGRIRVWRLGDKSGKVLAERKAHEDQILRLVWSADGKTIASASADKTIRLFEAEGLREVWAKGDQADWVYGLEFLPDGRLAAGRFDGSLTLYAP